MPLISSGIFIYSAPVGDQFISETVTADDRGNDLIGLGVDQVDDPPHIAVFQQILFVIVTEFMTKEFEIEVRLPADGMELYRNAAGIRRLQRQSDVHLADGTS